MKGGSSFWASRAVALSLRRRPLKTKKPSEACLGLGPLAGQPMGVRWTHSFTTFLDSHRADLSADQVKLIQQAIQLGQSESFSLKETLPLNTIKGIVRSAREMLTDDQYSEILARWAPRHSCHCGRPL